MTTTALTRKYWAGRNVVYRFFDEDDALMYVGLSSNFPARLASHRTQSWWAPRITRIRLQVFPTASAAADAEVAAIRSERPRFNLRHAQDTSKDHWTYWDLIYWAITTGFDPRATRDMVSPYAHAHDALADSWKRGPDGPRCSESDDPSCVAVRGRGPYPNPMPRTRHLRSVS